MVAQAPHLVWKTSIAQASCMVPFPTFVVLSVLAAALRKPAF